MLKRVCWGNWIFLFIVAGLLGITLLSGCGHKGDLYLPDTTETAQDKKKIN